MKKVSEKSDKVNVLNVEVVTPACNFILNETNAKKMIGKNDPENERWADIAGNFYSSAFCRKFSYEDTNGPTVWISIKPVAETLKGRLEAHGLKPNFAYQLKLMGNFLDRKSFENIGYKGRWRLPGRPTNYTDYDYEQYANKSNVEAYIIFDYFVTDGRGNAILDFSLDKSIHVLWNLSRQTPQVRVPDIRRYELDASDPEIYARPKKNISTEYIYAEPEIIRYLSNDKIKLPPGKYNAFLTLTEESFHSYGMDNGYWATPLKLPVEFYISGN